ncbi:hypothetical protein A8V01_21260 [Novosphingobium guangzhouense]|uniref:Putative tail fiber protein gp53-like C-terminal domain-containing protein n=2 Tax=Novosphingobium guangzhouense TaxID=1850347 RepID=A0A2K2FZR6_9SPHN|nr:hypothetical protein A8V01_21260 [Novosphingobium guangzhouense]
MKLAQNGYIRFFGFQMGWGRFSAGSNGSTAVDFAEAFPTACFSVVASGSSDTSSDAKDNWPAVQTSSITRTGFSVFNANDNSDNCAYIAVGY